MRAGDVAAMPGDIRHQGYSPKRSMLLVWENASPELPELIRAGKASVYPVDFSCVPRPLHTDCAVDGRRLAGPSAVQ